MASIPERVYQRLIHWADPEPHPQEPVECLISRYSTGSHGYAQIGWVEEGRKTMTLGHLGVWRWHHGPVPDGFTVDHRCHRRKCLELAHLRLLTNSDNASDNGQVRSNPQSDRLCSRGHKMAVTGGKTHYCRECMNANRRARRASGRAN